MYKIGFDVGGTNIAAGLLDASLEIVERSNVPFPHDKSAQEITVLLSNMVRELLEREHIAQTELECIGIAVPGSIDSLGDIVLDAYNLHFHKVPLRILMQEHFSGVPVFLVNDANAAALAELHKGVFVGCKTAVLLTLGTGVGGGLILDGKMFNGGNNSGVELGHMIMAHGMDLCTCGQRGCIETRCSATWLAQAGRTMAAQHSDGLMHQRANGKAEDIDAKIVIECAREKDRGAVEIFDNYVDALSSVLASLINLLDPEVIALGGGVSLAGDFLFEPLRILAEKKCFFAEYKGQIVPAAMGNDAGIIGAAMLMHN
ncbi:MAG: ROK family protein [Clostridia bacterium]